MRFFKNGSRVFVARYLVFALPLVVSCHPERSTIVSPQAEQSFALEAHTNSTPGRWANEITDWDQCVGPKNMAFRIDPGGQGPHMLGVGRYLSALRNDTTAGLAAIDLRGMQFIDVFPFFFEDTKTADGHQIVDMMVQGDNLTGKLSHNARTLVEGEGWKGATFEGPLQCPAAVGKVFRVKGTIVNAKRLAPLPAGAPLSNLNSRRVWTFELNLDFPGATMQACNDEKQAVVAIPGTWDGNSKYFSHEPMVSFACLDKEAAKCMEMGYDSPENAPLFEACTRMMRADYCGNGAPFTKEGSHIERWDNRSSPTLPNTPGTSFEAAWDANGMVCCNHLRWPLEPFVPLKPDSDVAKRNACIAKLSCSTQCTPQSAVAMRPGKPLIFNVSCDTHPCATEQPNIQTQPPDTTPVGVAKAIKAMSPSVATR